MRGNFTYTFTVAMLFLSILICHAEENVISDNFESDLAVWNKPANRHITMEKGQLGNLTPYASNISIKETNIGSFHLSFKLKLMKCDDPLSGHFTIGIDRGYGVWKLFFTRHDQLSQITSKFYPTNSDKKNLALFDEVIKTQLPFDKWINIAVTCSPKLYELSVDGVKFVLGTAPGNGGFSIGSYKQPFAIDDLKLTYSSPEQLSSNMIINGSFEHASNSDIPDYWAGNDVRYRNNGLPETLCTKDGINEFRVKFFRDHSQARHGEWSVRVESPFHLMNQGVHTKRGENYVVSCEIKSEFDKQKVVVGVTTDRIDKPVKEKIVEVDKTWRRFDLSLNNYQHENACFFVRPVGTGKIWVDSVQFEKGETASPFNPCWFDTGFGLPSSVNQNQCAKNFNGIIHNLRPHEIVSNKEIILFPLKLECIDPLKETYSIKMNIENQSTQDRIVNVIICMTEKCEPEQLKSAIIDLPAKNTKEVTFTDFVIKDIRAGIGIMVLDDKGKTLKSTREFVDVPKPLRVYAEYSYYTTEKEARIILRFGDEMLPRLDNGKVEVNLFVTGYPQYSLAKKKYDLKVVNQRQIISIPIKKIQVGKAITALVSILNEEGKTILRGEAELLKLRPMGADVRVNRLNRGVYVNGKPFLPYGILVPSLGEKQLKYYRECGFGYIQFISHWNKPETNLKFLENCDKLDIKAIAFHVARPYSYASAEIAKIYSSYPALIGIVPNDENANRIVYEQAIKVKAAVPTILNCVNHHFHSYNTFRNRIDGFPGDILSIDRYPFILQPPGRPQTTKDIHSYELCLEMMDKDGERERKPVFVWLQAAERFAKEPTPLQLTWQTYIALANHCMGFTYFGGIPNSERVWKRMIELNSEVQTLKPALFSLENEPRVKPEGRETEKNIKFIAKRLNDELIVICVNRTLRDVSASLDLTSAGISGSRNVEVMFEKRTIISDDKGLLKDQFGPMERHVYKLKIKE